MNMINPGEDGRLPVEIGKRLKRLRLEKGMTQKVLAAKVRDGVDYTYIGKIERGEQLPSLKVLLRISETLSVPIAYFFRDEPETVVYLDSSAELGFLLRDGKGRELLKTLRLLDSSDIPLIMEIVKILVRQKNSVKPEQAKDSGYPADDLLLAVKKDALFLEK
jgi:transcriptional regulator with XRE-family HTH domain